MIDLLHSLQRAANELTRIVLPSGCVACGAQLPLRARHASCCTRCWSELPRLEASCGVCALPITTGDRCLECIAAPPPAEWIASWGHYRGSLERVLHAFKFARHDFLDRELAPLLEETFAARADGDFDCVVPIPMHRKKLRARGYNQAELLARDFARRAALPFAPELLRKTTNNATQSTLPREERSKNVRRVFEADARVDGLAVLLVDDVCTTGETLQAAARTLLKRGARRVAALTVARA